jgi:hypothetical protein
MAFSSVAVSSSIPTKSDIPSWYIENYDLQDLMKAVPLSVLEIGREILANPNITLGEVQRYLEENPREVVKVQAHVFIQNLEHFKEQHKAAPRFGDNLKF